MRGGWGLGYFSQYCRVYESLPGVMQDGAGYINYFPKSYSVSVVFIPRNGGYHCDNDNDKPVINLVPGSERLGFAAPTKNFKSINQYSYSGFTIYIFLYYFNITYNQHNPLSGTKEYIYRVQPQVLFCKVSSK